MTMQRVLAGVLALITLGNAITWDVIRVKYTTFLGGYFPIPLKISDIKNNEYVFLANHEDFPTAKLYCLPDDPRVCALYDGQGNVAGIRVSYLISALQGKTKKSLPYSYEKPIFKKGKAYGEEFYYVDVLFISPESLMSGGPRTRKEAVGDGVYRNIDGQHWTKMPRTQTEAKKTIFTKQACFLGMGRHYFYNMTKQMKCEDHQPPFLLYDGEDMIGFGLIPFGQFTSKKRSWFEDPPKFVINTIVPTAPNCLADWVGEYGTISLHVFFKAQTRLTCIPLINKLPLINMLPIFG